MQKDATNGVTHPALGDPSDAMQSSTSRRISPASPKGPSLPPTAPWLAARAAFGYTEATAAQIEARGHDGWVDWQLLPDLIPDPRVDQELSRFPWLQLTPHEALTTTGIHPAVLSDQYKSLRLIRAVYSERQLFERTVEFWADHFNVFLSRFMRCFDDETAWRRHTFGTFRDLLHAVTRSASMIAYLDADENVVGAANENLARELFELHTISVDGPYTETDVREFARCLTGWTFNSDGTSPTFGSFTFRAVDHDTGPKSVLGLSFSGSEMIQEVTTVLDFLANHPSTVRFVTTKMARWFLGESPPAHVVDEAIGVWQQSGGRIAEIVRVLVSERAIRATMASGLTKFRRPHDWFTAVLRATGVTLPGEEETLSIMRTLGQVPFEWPSPDGYPDVRSRWAQLVQPRWETAASFARPGATPPGAPWNHVAADLMPLVQFASGATAPRRRWVRLLSRRLTGSRLTAVDLAQIQSHVNSLPPTTPDVEVLGEALELCLSCPSFQVI